MSTPESDPVSRSVPSLRVVGVSGSLHEPSKTTALVTAIVEAVAQRADVEVRLVEIAEIGPSLGASLSRAGLPADVEDAIRAVETADLLVVASPVYRATYTGLFKHLFDFVDQRALDGTPVLLAATGGDQQHSLVIEHQLRPLFGFFQALTLPLGVYASGADFDGPTLREAVRQRIEDAVTRGLPLVEQVAAQRAEALTPTP